MTRLHLLPLTLIAALGCAAADDGSSGSQCIGYKCDDGDQTSDYDETIPNIVPKEVWDFLQANEWGLYHVEFHSLRRWYLMDDEGREYWSRNGYQGADKQEGDPGSGLQFLAMHHAMIEKLHEYFDDYGYGDIFVGWDDDAKVLDAVANMYGQDSSEYRKVRTALTKLADFENFANDDEYGLFLQTNLRLGPLMEDQPSDWRNYVSSHDAGVGIHNYLHGLFNDDSSPINVGDPQTNLANRLFWGIHGYVEYTSQKYHAYYRAKMGYQDGEDDPDYLNEADLAGLHVQIHSHNYNLDGKPPQQNWFGDSPH